MPHIIIEYSANVEQWIEMGAFCELLRQTAASVDAFPMPGIRVRAYRADHYAVADGNANHGFIDIAVRLRGGRTLTVRQTALQTLFDAATTFLEPTLSQHSLALSMEMRDIDPELSPKTGTIRQHLESTSSAHSNRISKN